MKKTGRPLSRPKTGLNKTAPGKRGKLLHSKSIPGERQNSRPMNTAFRVTTRFSRGLPPCGCRRCCFVLLLLALWLGSLPAAAQESQVEVRAVSPSLLTVAPGEVLSLSFRVFNRGGQELELDEAPVLPPGWELIMAPGQFRLAPGAVVSRLLLLQVPRNALAGDYSVSFRVGSRRDYALAGEAQVSLVLGGLLKLKLMLEGSLPERVLAGQAFSLQARLLNQGNTAQSVNLIAQLPGRGQVSVSPAALTLQPGESRLLELSAAADPATPRLRRALLRLEARNAENEVLARLNQYIDVVPSVAGEDMYRRYPLQLGLHLAGKNQQSRLQGTLGGDGYLDEEETKRLDFFIRAPDQENKGTFGQRDEYRLRYREEGLSLRAGDQAYGLSELTSQGRYGRGLELALHPPKQPLSAGFYHVKDRWQLQKRQDSGGWLAYALDEDSSLRLNALSMDYKQWESLSAHRDNLLSLEGGLALGESRLEAELAFSDGGQPGQGSDYAWRLGLANYSSESLRYSLSARWAGPDYAGRYEDSAWYSGTLDFPLHSRLRANLSFRRYESNLDRLAARGSAPREDQYGLGLSASLPRRWRLSLGYDYFTGEDLRSPRSFAKQQHGLRIGLGHSFRVFSWQADLRRSWTEDQLSGYRYGEQNISLRGSYNPLANLYFSVFASSGEVETA